MKLLVLIFIAILLSSCVTSGGLPCTPREELKDVLVCPDPPSETVWIE